jgi:hypothetical protein
MPTVNTTELLAPYCADVDAKRMRLNQAASPVAFNLALANYNEAKAALKAAQRSLGISALAA